ncbi:hypothetical protein ACTWP6_23705 [Mycobacterium sp. 4D054]|uniref:hypothetical protein n=1 Tax=Mycobacterium sp. 4D054 TaxID=3457440 RepID=UPI003FD587A8
MTTNDRTAYHRAAEALRARFRREEEALHAEGFLTIVDAAAVLGVGRNAVSNMIADGRLHVTRWGDRSVTRPEWIAEVARRRKGPAEWRREHGWLSVAEAAEMMGITRQALNVRIRKGQQVAVRAGAPVPGAWLIRVEDVGRQAA